MAPIIDLNQLITNMRPVLLDEIWYYCQIKDEIANKEILSAAFAIIRETESITLILPQQQADTISQDQKGEKVSTPFRRIELQVFSSLEAVGLTAVISQCLQEHSISANVIAGFHHDHIFIPEEDAQKAIEALTRLSNSSG